MRSASLAIIGLLMATTPVHAASKAPEGNCVSSLKSVNETPGFKLVRKCGKASVAQKGAALKTARQPVKGGSNLADDDENGAAVIFTSLLASAAIIGGIIIAVDDEGRDLPISN